MAELPFKPSKVASRALANELVETQMDFLYEDFYRNWCRSTLLSDHSVLSLLLFYALDVVQIGNSRVWYGW